MAAGDNTVYLNRWFVVSFLIICEMRRCVRVARLLGASTTSVSQISRELGSIDMSSSQVDVCFLHDLKGPFVENNFPFQWQKP